MSGNSHWPAKQPTSCRAGRRSCHFSFQWRPQEYFRTAIEPEKWFFDLSALPSILSRYRAGGPWQGFAQFPQALRQSRGSARAGRCCQEFVIPAISASDMPIADGLAWQAGDGELREHGSSQLHMLPHRIEVRKSTSGAAARRVTQQWRCGRLSTRANMMPVLPPETCKDPKPWRAASEKSIAGYEDLLDGLLPIIDSVSEIAVRDGL